MKNWTIGTRITFASAMLCTLLVIVGAISWINLRSIRTEAVTLKGDVMPGLIDSSEFYSCLAKGFIRTQLYGQATKPEQRTALEAEMAKIVAEADAAIKRYEASISQPEDRVLFDKLTKAKDAYRPAKEHYIKLIDAGQAEAARDYLHETLFPLYRTYASASEELLAFNSKNGDTLAATIDTTTVHTNRAILLVASASLLLGAVVSVIIIRGTNGALNVVAQQLSAGADQTAAAAGQVSSASQSLAEGASEQAASLEETSASLEEISSMTKKNAESATEAKALANQTRQAAETGATGMAEMQQAMEAIKESSASIAKIVKTIDEIAFQTNILALNAAVEAARAGEAGAGFAVVAEEVRALAQRSAQSAKETAAKIEDSVNRSEHGVQISTRVGAGFGEIVAKARKVDDIVGEIANASREQSQGVGQVTDAVTQMDKVTQSNAASAEETASASEELNAQAEVMRESVRQLMQLVRRGNPAPAARQAAPVRPSATRTAAKRPSPASPAATPAPAQPARNAEPVAAGRELDQFFN